MPFSGTPLRESSSAWTPCRCRGGSLGVRPPSGGEAWPTEKLTKLPANVLPASQGCIRAPTVSGVELLRGAVSQPVVLLQVRHPVISYYVWRILLHRRRAKSEPWWGVDLGISRGYVRGQPEKAGPYLLDMRIVLAIQLIPCRNENGLRCFGRQVLLLLGCSLIPVCRFLRRRRIRWSALPTPFSARGRDRLPSGGTSTIGIWPVIGYSDDTLILLVRRDAEPTCGFLARSPCGPAAFLFWKGNCTSIFCRWGWISTSPSSSGNGDCGLSVSSGCWAAGGDGGSPGLGFSKKGKLGNSEDVNAGVMSPTLRDRNSML